MGDSVLTMKRLTLRTLAGLSTVLLTLVVLFWFRSHSVGDFVCRDDGSRILLAESVGGLLRVAWGDWSSREFPVPRGWTGSFWPFRRTVDYYETDLHRGTRLGFGWQRWRARTPELTADTTMLTVPHWAVGV